MRVLVVLSLAACVALPLAVVPADSAAAAAAFDVPANDFISASAVTLTGTKDAGSTLVIRLDGQVVCTAADPVALTWQCPDIAVPNGILTFTGDETLADASVVAIAALTLRVLTAPTLDGAGGSLLTTGRFSGSAQPGASIQLQSTGPGGTESHSCPAALPDGFWSCVVALETGSYQVRARQSVPTIGPEFSSYTAPVAATVDRTAPSPPTITSPRSGPITFAAVTARGGGEPDALLQLFVDSSLVCETVVSSSGSWACPIRFSRAGTVVVQALQRDAAGNFSSASAAVEVRYSPPAPAPEASAEAPAPAPAPSETATPTPTPTPLPSASARPAPPELPTSSNWGTATGFGSSLPTAEQVVQRGGWAIAPLAGIAYLLLAALPLRAFVTHVVPRLRRPRIALTGRNRGADVVEQAPLVVSPVLVAAGTLGGAAIIAALSGGVDAEVRYLRLTAAIGLGLVLLNLIAVLFPAWLAGRVARHGVMVRLLPGILLVALITALISRFGGLQPPLLAGVLIAATAAVGAGRRARAGVAVAQTSGVAALALVGWAGHDLLTPSTGFWMTLASETAAAVALGGLGSLLMILLPVGPLPGRTLYAVSPPAWAAVALASATVAGAILVSGPAFPLTALMLTGAAFAATLTAAVVYTRWVAPAWR